MKTLFISYNGALEPLVQSQGIPYLKGLSRKGVKCILLTFEKPNKIKNNFRKIDYLKSELRNYGIKWYYLKYHKNPSFPATLFDMLMGIIVGLYIVILKKVDIIHARATVPAVIGFILAKFTGKKFIFDERGLMAEEYIEGGIWKRDSLLYKLTLNIEKILLRRADFLIVLSQNIKNFLMNSDYFLENHAGKKLNISFIPCCVDVGKFNMHSPLSNQLRNKYRLSGKFVFLYSGSIGTWYLLEEMIDFFQVAKTVIKNAHFLILTHIGKDTVKDTCKRRGLSLDEFSVEEVEFEEMPDYIKLAEIGIFFIKPVFSKRSSCPTKFAEYLACGLPVLINAGIGDTDKIVEEHKLGVVINEFTKESYLSKINILLELMKEKDLVSERCRRVAQEIFSLDKGVSQYFDIYNKVLYGSKISI